MKFCNLFLNMIRSTIQNVQKVTLNSKENAAKWHEPEPYFDFGLAHYIRYMLDRYYGHLTNLFFDKLKFIINTDVFLVSKASGSQVWPFQCRFLDSLMVKWTLFLVREYYGNSNSKTQMNVWKVLSIQRSYFSSLQK